MKKLRIYLDTSVIGGCFDSEFSLWSNGLLEDFKMGNYQPIVSEVVAAEIEDAPEQIQEKYAEIIGMGAEYLEISEEVLELADVYLKNHILTPKFSDDMMHIALSTVANLDILVSWNFKHIVHYDKIRQFNAVNLRLGYKSLQIFSPREVSNYEDKNRI